MIVNLMLPLILEEFFKLIDDNLIYMQWAAATAGALRAYGNLQIPLHVQSPA